jgi:hypothetical protein
MARQRSKEKTASSQNERVRLRHPLRLRTPLRGSKQVFSILWTVRLFLSSRKTCGKDHSLVASIRFGTCPKSLSISGNTWGFTTNLDY